MYAYFRVGLKHLSVYRNQSRALIILRSVFWLIRASVLSIDKIALVNEMQLFKTPMRITLKEVCKHLQCSFIDLNCSGAADSLGVHHRTLVRTTESAKELLKHGNSSHMENVLSKTLSQSTHKDRLHKPLQ